MFYPLSRVRCGARAPARVGIRHDVLGGTTRQQRVRPADLISTNNRAHLSSPPPMLAALTHYLRAISAVAAGGGSFAVSVSVAIAQFLMPVVGSQQSMV